MYSLFYTITCIELLLAGLRLGGYSFSIHDATSGSHPSWLGSMYIIPHLQIEKHNVTVSVQNSLNMIVNVKALTC